MLVLVVGANGQLGAALCAALVRRGHQTRGSVRAPERGKGLPELGVDVAVADLAGPDGLRAVLEGVEAVVLTANPVVPRASDDPAAVHRGMQRLVDDAVAAGVRRLVLPSVPTGHVDPKVPAIAARRALEQHLLAASLESVVLRFPVFMEVWLALVGSSIPLRGEPHATVARSSPFLDRFRQRTGTLVEDRGLLLAPGSAQARHSFIAIDDVVTAVADTVEAAAVRKDVVEIGGPEVLTWQEVAQIYGDVLGRRVRVVPTPAAGYAVASGVLRRWAVPSATLALNRFMAATETPWAPGGPGLLDPRKMTTVRDFLTHKASLPAEPGVRGWPN